MSSTVIQAWNILPKFFLFLLNIPFTVQDKYSRFPFAFASPDMSSQVVIKCLVKLFVIFGMPMYGIPTYVRYTCVRYAYVPYSYERTVCLCMVCLCTCIRIGVWVWCRLKWKPSYMGTEFQRVVLLHNLPQDTTWRMVIVIYIANSY